MKHLLLTTIAAVLLVGCGPQPPNISIYRAVQKGSIEAVKQHLAAGTDVNAKNERGATPLHLAGDHKEVAELLIKKGADVNAKDYRGITPLHVGQTKEVAALLIAEGADVNAKTNVGKTPLDLAEEEKHKEIATLLRKHGGKTKEELKPEGK
jgi:ankyrin repeat protein